MAEWIEHLGSPERLLLEWRAPEVLEDRMRWVVGELRHADGGACFQYYTEEQLREHNKSRGGAALEAAGFTGYPAFPWKMGTKYCDGALEAFKRRLPSPRRPDFNEYLQTFRLLPGREIPDLALLAATGAILPGDGFKLVDPLDGQPRVQDVVLEVAGVQYYPAETEAGGLKAALGAQVNLTPEPNNVYDPHAVRIDLEGRTIGYVGRVQAVSIGHWLSRGRVEAWLARVNGSIDHPKAHILVKLRDAASSDSAAT